MGRNPWVKITTQSSPDSRMGSVSGCPGVPMKIFKKLHCMFLGRGNLATRLPGIWLSHPWLKVLVVYCGTRVPLAWVRA